MKTNVSIWVWALIAITGIFLSTGCAHRRTVYVTNPAMAPGDEVVVTETPPAPQVEVVGVAPGPEYIWVPGWWEWHGRWVWMEGRWTVGPHPHARWEPGHWVHHGRGYVWRPGRWR